MNWNNLSALLVMILLIFIILASSGIVSAARAQQTRIGLVNVASLSSPQTPIIEIPVQNESLPLGITIGPNNDIWFAENNATAIIEYNPNNQSFKSYTVPSNGTSMIWFMVFDSSGNLWFSNQLQPYLWRFTPATGQFENFSTGSEYVRPFAIAYDNSTNRIWFTSTYTDQIGYFNLDGENASMGGLINVTGTAVLKIPPLYGPTGIQIDLEGNVFISEPFSANIVEYSPSEQRFVNVWRLPNEAQPVGIAFDNADGTIWFANHASSLFGYLNITSGKVTEFATSPYEFFGDTISLPYWDQLSSSGIVWFDEHASNKIARYDPATGLLTEFEIPTNQSSPLRFVIDNRLGEVWFTEFFGSNLAKVAENASCQCTVQLSSRYLTMTSNSLSFYLKYIAPFNQTLSSNSPNPLIAGTFQTDGLITNNLTTSFSITNSTDYKITLSRGPELLSGNYTITVCPRITSSDNITSPAPIRQCATAFISVLNHSTQPQFLIYLVVTIGVVAAGVATLVLTNYFRKKSRNPQSRYSKPI
ncbi:MAG: hypothetical protein JRN15_01890 [Nitrososphaerota archaeon]|nr:hypothetical protein [Nitrososphaerota archaeon]